MVDFYGKTYGCGHRVGSFVSFLHNGLLSALLTGVILGVLCCSVASGEAVQAVTADGRAVLLYPDGTWGYKASLEKKHTVILRPDGTWRYHEPTASASEPIPTYTRPESATTFVTGEQVPYGIWLDHGLWQRATTSPRSVVERRFTHASGKAWAAVIAESTRLSVEAVRDFVLASAKRHMPDATILREENRLVNRHDILFMQIAGTSNGVPHTYLTYDYVGEIGTVQVYTWVASDVLAQYQDDLLNFLNGFDIYGEDGAPTTVPPANHAQQRDR